MSAVVLLASERPAVLLGALVAAPLVAVLTPLGPSAAPKYAAAFWTATALRSRAPMPLRGEASAAAGGVSAVRRLLPLLARCTIVLKKEASLGVASLSWRRRASSFSANVCTRGSTCWYPWQGGRSSHQLGGRPQMQPCQALQLKDCVHLGVKYPQLEDCMRSWGIVLSSATAAACSRG